MFCWWPELVDLAPANFVVGNSQLSDSDLARLVPDGLVAEARSAVHLIHPEWAFESYGWSCLIVDGSECIQYIDAIYRHVGVVSSNERGLGVRTWIGWDTRDGVFESDLVAEHLYLHLLAREGDLTDRTRSLVADARRRSSGPALAALGATARSVEAFPAATVAGDDAILTAAGNAPRSPS